MEFDFNVNALFPDTISLITRDSVAGKIDHQRSKYQKNLEVGCIGHFGNYHLAFYGSTI